VEQEQISAHPIYIGRKVHDPEQHRPRLEIIGIVFQNFSKLNFANISELARPAVIADFAKSVRQQDNRSED